MKNSEITLTENELKLLKEIKYFQNEEGNSEFCSDSATTKKIQGTLSSLARKGLIYNSIDMFCKGDFKFFDEKPFKMWCLTRSAVKIVGIPEDWN